MLQNGLYAITAEELHPGRPLLEVMEETLQGGAKMIQYRDKNGSKKQVIENARALSALAKSYDVPFIMNDHLDVALIIDADGVHFGQDDVPLTEARKLLGPNKLIGISTHSLEEAVCAERDGADYIGVGPVFATATKKDAQQEIGLTLLREIVEGVAIPTVAIGGINQQNALSVIETGVTQVAVISDVLQATSVKQAAQTFQTLYDQGRKKCLKVATNGC
ncbi:thiamine phosphate synthase [Geomicrobium sp. JCM 19055]|uniref:thiamine phosphate synthase n=1 Tax=Geomicrobium sp. JCM 19055 TaxID=1460649 RepID=UPI0005A851C9|nr:thiamine phosphate synthase [Geomicrobium sp. JCM 19055]